MLLSDRDILAAQAEGHISLDPWTPEMVQPASIDVRLDRFFRLFNNHAYTYVDPAENQGELTEQFEVASDEPWILHPGEFALGSTWEYVKLDPTIAARLEGKSSLGRLGLLTLHRAARILLAVELVQGTIGFWQYFTDLPEILVGLHMLGAGGIFHNRLHGRSLPRAQAARGSRGGS